MRDTTNHLIVRRVPATDSLPDRLRPAERRLSHARRVSAILNRLQAMRDEGSRGWLYHAFGGAMALQFTADELRELSLAILAYRQSLDRQPETGFDPAALRSLDSARSKIMKEWERVDKEVRASNATADAPPPPKVRAAGG